MSQPTYATKAVLTPIACQLSAAANALAAFVAQPAAPSLLVLDGNALLRITPGVGQSVVVPAHTTVAPGAAAGSAGAAAAAAGSVAAAPAFDRAVDVTADGFGAVFVADAKGVWHVSVSSGTCKRMAEFTGADARYAVRGVCADPTRGNVYVSHGHAVTRVDSRGVVTAPFCGHCDASGYHTGDADASLLHSPAAMCFDATRDDGSVLLLDTTNHRIRRVNAIGQSRLLAGDGVPGHSDERDASLAMFGGEPDADADADADAAAAAAAGAAAAARPNASAGAGTGAVATTGLSGIAVSADGTVYVAENGPYVRVITPKGAVSTVYFHIPSDLSAAADDTNALSTFRARRVAVWSAAELVVLGSHTHEPHTTRLYRLTLRGDSSGIGSSGMGAGVVSPFQWTPRHRPAEPAFPRRKAPAIARDEAAWRVRWAQVEASRDPDSQPVSGCIAVTAIDTLYALPKKSWFSGAADPYVVLWLTAFNGARATAVLRKDLMPRWRFSALPMHSAADKAAAVSGSGAAAAPSAKAGTVAATAAVATDKSGAKSVGGGFGEADAGAIQFPVPRRAHKALVDGKLELNVEVRNSGAVFDELIGWGNAYVSAQLTRSGAVLALELCPESGAADGSAGAIAVTIVNTTPAPQVAQRPVGTVALLPAAAAAVTAPSAVTATAPVALASGSAAAATAAGLQMFGVPVAAAAAAAPAAAAPSAAPVIAASAAPATAADVKSDAS